MWGWDKEEETETEIEDIEKEVRWEERKGTERKERKKRKREQQRGWDGYIKQKQSKESEAQEDVWSVREKAKVGDQAGRGRRRRRADQVTVELQYGTVQSGTVQYGTVWYQHGQYWLLIDWLDG